MPVVHQVRLAEVIFSDFPFGVYTYRIPPELGDIETGVRLKVPFRNRFRIGIATKVFPGSDSPELKDVCEAIDVQPLVPPDLLTLTRWIADYYLCEWGEALAAAIPSGLKPTSKIKYRLSEIGLAEPFLNEEPGPAGDLWRELSKQPLSLGQITRRFSSGESLLEKFRQKRWIETAEFTTVSSAPSLTCRWQWTGSVTFDEALQQLPKNAVKLRQSVEILAKSNGTITQKELVVHATGLSPIMRNIEKKGWVESSLVPFHRLGDAHTGIAETATGEVILTQAQREIVSQIEEALSSNSYRSFLLHGVTGSGKTLVYLEAIDRALKLGRDAIVMVPEISLTPQLTGRIHRRFGSAVVVTHSGMTPAERRDVWRLIRDGRAKVVVGPRSAVFAPVQNPGLIVVDEEHDDSYKQADPAPRYHGRDVAIYRAYHSGAVVLMGSATPDVCTYKNALNGKYRLVELRERFGGGDLPAIRVVKWGLSEKISAFSPMLDKKLRDVLEIGEQTILLVNRRAFSTVIRCPDCGTVANCPNCDITLRYHRSGGKLACHYCGYEQTVIDTCPACKGKRLIFSGIGTQRVQRELEIMFPKARLERMDVDVTRQRGSHQEILAKFANREIDVLIGTQMVAKGHDFPGVKLVGVLAADYEWLRPDFRTVEKAFRLLTQASGRTGRAGSGEVVIQAWDPTQPMLRWVQDHNYQKLYEKETSARQPLGYPPFGSLIGILVRGPDRVQVVEAANELKKKLVEQTKDLKILGPSPPLIERIENQYRRMLLIKMPPRGTGHIRSDKEAIRIALQEQSKRFDSEDIVFKIEVDPVEIQ